MIRREKCIVFDIDGTICTIKTADQSYDDVVPHPEVLAKLREYRALGFYIILATSRNMNSYNGNVGLLVARTAKQLFAWFDRYDIPYDELHVGKPWPGRNGFYVDDKAIRPDEFVNLDYAQILALVGDAQEAE
ncbi:capsular biosynthesis protein [Sphingosinithalassobacter sp. CS137]|uniref:capsular biosynthesis protein n=1 Tax=Sphingosinithalassobacter sp. CS137 TaxID=2762748 RepID=UPI00165E3986|nr:capsular biosynthesis protein [Sphingosinithalassobacter sp. CS137]